MPSRTTHLTAAQVVEIDSYGINTAVPKAVSRDFATANPKDDCLTSKIRLRIFLSTMAALLSKQDIVNLNADWVVKFIRAAYEVVRSNRTNRDIFDDESEFEAYRDDLIVQIDQVCKMFEMRKKVRQEKVQMSEVLRDVKLKGARPNFSRGFLSQPWQQFLHPAAPGWFADVAAPPGVISKQRIPHGGVSVIRKWEDHAQTIFNDHGRVQGGPSRFKSGLMDSVKPGNQVQLKDAITTAEMTVFDGNPYEELYTAEVGFKGQSFYAGDLFPVSKMLANLDLDGGYGDWVGLSVQVRET